MHLSLEAVWLTALLEEKLAQSAIPEASMQENLQHLQAGMRQQLESSKAFQKPLDIRPAHQLRRSHGAPTSVVENTPL